MKKKSLSTGGAKIFVYVFLILLAVICLFPFYILIINATEPMQIFKKAFLCCRAVRFYLI